MKMKGRLIMKRQKNRKLIIKTNHKKFKLLLYDMIIYFKDVSAKIIIIAILNKNSDKY